MGRSLKKQLISIVTLIIVLSIVSISSVVIRDANDLMSDTEERKTQMVVENVRAEIDVEQFEEVLKEGEQHPYYDELRMKLDEYRKVAGLQYLYTMIAQGNNYYYAVDGNDLFDEENFSSFMSEEPEPDETLKNVFSTGEIYTENITKTDDGILITSYAPIVNKNNEVIAVLGADVDAEHIIVARNKFINGVVSITLIVFVLGLLIIIFYSRRLSREVNRIKDGIEQLSHGNLNIEIGTTNRKDEVKSLNDAILILQEQLKSFVQNLQLNSKDLEFEGQRLNEIVEQNVVNFTHVDEGVEKINRRSKLQYESMEKVVQLSEQNEQSMGCIINLLEELEQINKIGKLSSLQGEETIGGVTDSIVSMNRQILTSSEKVQHLSDELKQIENILNLINEISAQTNLLALNASIEAARAGDVGKGFSVVADEIRKLSDATAKAVEQIATLVNNVSTSSTGTRTEMASVVNQSNENKLLIERVEQAMKELIENSQQYERTLHEIELIQTTAERNVNEIQQAALAALDASNDIVVEVQNVEQLSLTQKEENKKVKLARQDILNVSLKMKEQIAQFKS